MSPKRNTGIRVLYPCGTDDVEQAPSTNLDIVFIHGINGDPFETWTHKASKTMWPRDLLPKKFPNARIMTFGYNADIFGSTSTAGIRDNARSLLATLLDEREDFDEMSPIVFVAHSLGGIILKQALRFAENEPQYSSIASATQGIVLFGTPHHGSDEKKWLSIAKAFAFYAAGEQQSRLVSALADNSRDLLEISEDFRHIARNYAIVSFYETEVWPGTSSVIVDRMSAVMMLHHEEQIPLNGNHLEMCQFDNDPQGEFKTVWKAIRRAEKGNSRKAADTYITPTKSPAPLSDSGPAGTRSRPSLPANIDFRLPTDLRDVTATHTSKQGQNTWEEDHTRSTRDVQPRPPTDDEYAYPVKNESKDAHETLIRKHYTVGIVCALQKELMAVRILFDSRHEDLEIPSGDTNHYSLGRIGQYNVVTACLPSGEYGTNSAADVISHMKRSFPGVEFCLLVGIGGGVPSKQNDIRLGDVVVSHPTDTCTGVIQYDFGKVLQSGVFQRTGSLQRPPRFLMSAISSLKSDPDLSPEPLGPYIEDIIARKPEYKYPGPENDTLFATKYVHDPTQETCEQCSASVERKRRPGSHPNIHYGVIASGNQVMKDAKIRDRLGVQDKVLCFEMEAAGVMNTVPCLVIRGICDYADSHKNKLWQEYAAATAAAYAKLLLCYCSFPQSQRRSKSHVTDSAVRQTAAVECVSQETPAGVVGTPESIERGSPGGTGGGSQSFLVGETENPRTAQPKSKALGWLNIARTEFRRIWA